MFQEKALPFSGVKKSFFEDNFEQLISRLCQEEAVTYDEVSSRKIGVFVLSYVACPQTKSNRSK